MKKFWIIFISLMFLVAPSYSDELTEDYFDIANNYLQAGDTTKALEYIDYVLMMNPKYSKAIDLKNKLIPQESNDDMTRTAITLANQKNVADLAILDIPKTNKYKIENTSDYYNSKGKQYYLSEDFDNAIQCFFRAVTIDGKNYIAYNNLGLSYWRKNNLDFAEKYFKKAANLGKTYPQPYINLALLAKQRGDNNKQIQYLDKALEVNPQNYWSYYLIGDYYTTKDDFASAIPYYVDTININPNFAPPYLALAVAYFKTDKYEQSITTLKNYIELNSKSDFAYSMLGKNYYLLGDYAKAKKYVKTAMNINPTYTYRMDIAKIEYNAGEYSNALINFQILEPYMQTAELYNYIGLCNLMLRRFEMAIINFNKAIVLDSGRPIYYYNLSQVYKALDDKQNYVKYMNTALQITPTSYQDYIDLSCIYYNTSKPALAVKILQNGISAEPNCKQLYLALLNIYDRLDDAANYNIIKAQIETRFNSNAKKKTNKLFK